MNIADEKASYNFLMDFERFADLYVSEDENNICFSHFMSENGFDNVDIVALYGLFLKYKEEFRK